jgi:hypothetical protein
VHNFRKAAQDGTQVAFVDCVANEALYYKYEVTSFPNLKLFSHGIVTEDFRARAQTDFMASNLAKFVAAATPGAAQRLAAEAADGWAAAVADAFPRITTVDSRGELIAALRDGDERATVIGHFPNRDSGDAPSPAAWAFSVASNARKLRSCRFVEIAAGAGSAALVAELGGGSGSDGAVILAMPLAWTDAASSALGEGEPSATLARVPKGDVAKGADALAEYLSPRVWPLVNSFSADGALNAPLFDHYRPGFRKHLLLFARHEGQAATLRKAAAQIAAIHRGALLAILVDDADMNTRFEVTEFPALRFAVSEKRALRKYAFEDFHGEFRKTVAGGDDTAVRDVIEEWLGEFSNGNLVDMEEAKAAAKKALKTAAKKAAKAAAKEAANAEL